MVRHGLTPVLISLIIGLIFGFGINAWAGAFAAFCFLAAVFLLHIYRFQAFTRWLEMPNNEPPPEIGGVWGDIFARVYKARKKTEKNAAKLHERDQRFRQTLNFFPDGVVLTRKDWEIEFLNPIATRDFGLDPAKDLGKILPEAYGEEEFRKYVEKSDWESPLNFQSADGRRLEIRIFPAGRKHWIVVSRDETEAMRVDSLRQDFVANVSHELRTPLTVIKGFLELQEESPAASDEDHLHWKLMRDQADRMGALVDDLLALSRLERDSAPAAEIPVDVRELLQRAAEDGRALSQGRHDILIAKVGGAKLLCDPKEMQSAVTNLVTNAVRYTPDGGTISLFWTREEDGWNIAVQDTGIGIAKEDIPRITERFYRVDKSRSRETGGTGLGLAIVKHVLFRHRAQLKIESELGAGSVFRIVFPLSRIEPEKETAVLSAPFGSEKNSDRENV
jgi:two-component system phosphate regulon sensor histidine kinase PhoR